MILPQIRAVTTGLAEKTPKDAVSTLQTAADGASEAIDGIAGYELSSSLSGKGFQQGRGAAVPLGEGRAGQFDPAVPRGSPPRRVGVRARRQRSPSAIARAESLLNLADAAVLRFQTHQTEALASAGIIRQPTIPGA